MFGLLKKKPSPEPTQALRPSQLQPRIKHLNFLAALQAGGVPPEQMPLTRPLCGELLVTWVFDLPDSLRMATPTMLREAGVDAADLPRLALDNLQRALPQPQFFAKDGCGLAHTGQDMEATLLLVDAVWDQMQPNFRGRILAAVPCRDVVLMCDSADAAATAALQAQAREFFDEHQGQHRLSTQVMMRENGAWSLHPAG
jgi:uncharacterized protein YtpQ (UPF0354 family)